MKKSKIMRIAALLMVAVLLTTCAISGTFAKYVTEGTSAAQTARVAKWGVTITAGDGAAFAKTYDGDGDLSVESDTEVVAPGTKGEVSSLLTIAGTPEVATKIEYTGTLTLTGFDEYFPIVIKVGDTTISGTAAEAASAFTNAIVALSGEYAPNTNLAYTFPTISWEWPFETSGNDVNDTALGNAAAASASNAATISFTVAATAVQLDTFTEATA